MWFTSLVSVTPWLFHVECIPDTGHASIELRHLRCTSCVVGNTSGCHEYTDVIGHTLGSIRLNALMLVTPWAASGLVH